MQLMSIEYLSISVMKTHKADTIQLYCQVTNAQGMCYGTEHNHTHTHTSHIKKKTLTVKTLK